jgi:hypothetical protein
MSSYPVKRKARAIRVLEGDVVDVPPPVAKGSGGFSFRYSYAEFSGVGASARVKAGRARYEGGKLTTESFEGELDPKAYERVVSDAGRVFADATASYLRAFGSFFLPSARGRDSE